MGWRLLICSGDAPWTRLNCTSCSPSPCPTSPRCGLLKGRWAWIVGGFFFTQGSGRTPNCSACYLPSIFFLTFTVPSCLLLSYQVCHPPQPSFLAPCPFRLPGDLFCFLLCFFFCFECLSLQVSVAGRSPFRSQRLQCKFPFPLGKCTTLFWGFGGVFCFSVFLFCFVSFAFFSLLFGGNGESGNREVGGGFCLFF